MDVIKLKTNVSFFAIKNDKGSWLNKSSAPKGLFSWSNDINSAKVYASRSAAARLKSAYLHSFPESAYIRIVEFIASQAKVLEDGEKAPHKKK